MSRTGLLSRQLLTLAAAIMLPLVILGGLQLYTEVNASRHALEARSRDRAAEIMHLVDTQLTAEIKLGNILASAVSQNEADVPGAYALAQKFRAESGTWKSVRMIQPSTGLQLFDLRKPLSSAAVPASPGLLASLQIGGPPSQVKGLMRGDDGAPYISMVFPVPSRGSAPVLLVVEIDPNSIHALASSRYPLEGIVSAVVDRQGHFVSRSLDQDNSVGRLGSIYLQAAAKRGGGGLYKNVTLEGVRSYTAYIASQASGWSTHVALPATPFDAARLWSGAIRIAIVLVSLFLSGLLVWFTLRQLREAQEEQQRALQAQKLEAVGHLTGGIAHDFNNLLTAIIGGLDLFLRRSDPADRNRRYLEGALEAAQRGAKLTSRLLAFSRTQRLEVKAVDIRTVLDDMSPLLDQSLGQDITWRAIVSEDARWVSTDQNQLELALLNLAINARDAMPAGGMVTIEAKKMNRRRNGEPWTCASLSVTDTGVGMQPHVRSQAFDPFFTTKDAHKGTGLGLAQVYSLARQSGGDTEIDSEPGKGTTVCLLLPLATEETRAADASEPLPRLDKAAGQRGKRIMIVDDDDAVRQVMAENLRSNGYVVCEASSGEDALAALQDNDPDLVVVDFLMPGLNGAQVAQRAREFRPDQKLLMVSGHMDSALVQAAAPNLRILRKPFEPQVLVQCVAEVLST